jgi:SAM-dependent methyltransferase
LQSVNAGRASAAKDAVRAYWEANACGEVYAAGAEPGERLAALRHARYALEPYIHAFADFPSGAGRDVLEIGVGMGCDHLEWAKSRPRRLAGVDLTERAVEVTRGHLALFGLRSELRTADAEALPFADETFDIVYSWGVLHHSPDTRRAVAEVHRVLRRGGCARVMIYQRRSIVAYLLWLRYALLAGRPGRSLDAVLAERLESPGTKAYSPAEARALFAAFAEATVAVQLNHADLLLGEAGRRHGGALLGLARALWPRWLIRRLLRDRGLYLLIAARK